MADNIKQFFWLIVSKIPKYCDYLNCRNHNFFLFFMLLSQAETSSPSAIDSQQSLAIPGQDFDSIRSTARNTKKQVEISSIAGDNRWVFGYLCIYVCVSYMYTPHQALYNAYFDLYKKFQNIFLILCFKVQLLQQGT